jgi:hypothetical protein
MTMVVSLMTMIVSLMAMVVSLMCMSFLRNNFFNFSLEYSLDKYLYSFRA